MKDEIKEILELYKNDDIEYYNLVSDLGYDKLLDYITDLEDTLIDREEYCYGLETQLTNLQEENKIKDKEIERLNNIIDEARKYIENNQSGGETNGHFHINFDGDIWELYEMLRRF